MVPQLSIGGARGWEVTDVNLHSIMKQAVCRLSKGKCCDKAMPNGAVTPDLTNQGIINYICCHYDIINYVVIMTL